MTCWKRLIGSWTPELWTRAAKSPWRAFIFSSTFFPVSCVLLKMGRETQMQLYRKSSLQIHCGLTLHLLYRWWKLLSAVGWRSSDKQDVVPLFVLVNSGSLVALVFSGLMWISYFPSDFNSSCFLKIVLVVKLVRVFLFVCFDSLFCCCSLWETAPSCHLQSQGQMWVDIAKLKLTL